jgi:hypothetical protein
MTTSEMTERAAQPAQPVSVPLVTRAAGLAQRLLAMLPHPRRTPLTFWYLVVLLVSTVVLYLVSGSIGHALLLDSSTNLVQLGHHPLLVLVASGLWLPGKDWVYYAVALTAALAPLERRLGSLRTLLIVAAGHVGVTLLTEGGVGLGILLHRLPVSEVDQMDVGASYVLMTAVGATIGLLPTVVRWPVLAVAGYWLAVAPALDSGLGGLDMTDLGHLLCLLTGVASWWWLRRRGALGTGWPVGDPLRHAVPAPPAAPAALVSRELDPVGRSGTSR